jgi:hypothetical protein
MDAHQESMGACMNVWWKETVACQEMMEACLESKELTLVEIRVRSGAWGGP